MASTMTSAQVPSSLPHRVVGVPPDPPNWHSRSHLPNSSARIGAYKGIAKISAWNARDRSTRFPCFLAFLAIQRESGKTVFR